LVPSTWLDGWAIHFASVSMRGSRSSGGGDGRYYWASMEKLVTCGRYAVAARSSMCMSSKTSCPLNLPKKKSRESARSKA